MEVINVTEEQRYNLCNELARLLFEFKKNKSVKCIYFAPYNCLDNMEGHILEITLVREGISDDLEEKIRVFNSLYQQQDVIDKCGLRIYLDSDTSKRWALTTLNPDEFKRENYLLNSVILYDADGECTKTKEQVTNAINYDHRLVPRVYDHLKNLAEIKPPIEEILKRIIDDARDKRDTEAVKEFTKSVLFRQFKGI